MPRFYDRQAAINAGVSEEEIDKYMKAKGLADRPMASVAQPTEQPQQGRGLLDHLSLAGSIGGGLLASPLPGGLIWGSALGGGLGEIIENLLDDNEGVDWGGVGKEAALGGVGGVDAQDCWRQAGIENNGAARVRHRLHITPTRIHPHIPCFRAWGVFVSHPLKARVDVYADSILDWLDHSHLLPIPLIPLVRPVVCHASQTTTGQQQYHNKRSHSNHPLSLNTSHTIRARRYHKQHKVPTSTTVATTVVIPI